MENKNLTWSSEEFKAHDKTTLWYAIFALTALALIGYAIYIQNNLTIITFGVIIVIGFFIAHQKPQVVKYQLTSTSVIIGQIAYPYRNIKKFWIIYTPLNKTVNFETTAYLNNPVSMQLGNQDPVQVKEYLKNYLPEDLDKEESLTDALARKIKF